MVPRSFICDALLKAQNFSSPRLPTQGMMQPLWLAGPTIIINLNVDEQHSHTLQNHSNVRFEILKEVWPEFMLAQFIY
jgi:hypothetical protein